jgi:hypothetical protein
METFTGPPDAELPKNRLRASFPHIEGFFALQFIGALAMPQERYTTSVHRLRSQLLSCCSD